MFAKAVSKPKLIAYKSLTMLIPNRYIQALRKRIRLNNLNKHFKEIYLRNIKLPLNELRCGKLK